MVCGFVAAVTKSGPHVTVVNTPSLAVSDEHTGLVVAVVCVEEEVVLHRGRELVPNAVPGLRCATLLVCLRVDEVGRCPRGVDRRPERQPGDPDGLAALVVRRHRSGSVDREVQRASATRVGEHQDVVGGARLGRDLGADRAACDGLQGAGRTRRDENARGERAAGRVDREHRVAGARGELVPDAVVRGRGTAQAVGLHVGGVCRRARRVERVGEGQRGDDGRAADQVVGGGWSRGERSADEAVASQRDRHAREHRTNPPWRHIDPSMLAATGTRGPTRTAAAARLSCDACCLQQKDLRPSEPGEPALCAPTTAWFADVVPNLNLTQAPADRSLSMPEFFEYLHDHSATTELAKALAEVTMLRTCGAAAPARSLPQRAAS